MGLSSPPSRDPAPLSPAHLSSPSTAAAAAADSNISGPSDEKESTLYYYLIKPGCAETVKPTAPELIRFGVLAFLIKHLPCLFIFLSRLAPANV